MPLEHGRARLRADRSVRILPRRRGRLLRRTARHVWTASASPGERLARRRRCDAQRSDDPRRSDYDPRRPDFIEVAGGFPARTGGAGGGASGWSLVGSAVTDDDGSCGPFLFFEKSGMSFFFFMLVSVQEEHSVLALVELSRKVSTRMR